MDLIEDPSTIRKAFEGRAYTLKLGYFGVVCRSQKDMRSGVSLEQALRNEASFFSKNREFQEFTAQMGIKNLTHKVIFFIFHIYIY